MTLDQPTVPGSAIMMLDIATRSTDSPNL